MPTLHIVRQSAFQTNDFFQCSQVLQQNDAIVFTDDGCYNLQHSLMNVIHKKKNIQLHVMQNHAVARAISLKNSLVTEINMRDLVKLTFDNDRVITWQ